jgi:hypothetical protein
MASTLTTADFSQDEAALLITFAGQAMQALVTEHLKPSAVAAEAFDIAEAMVNEYRRRVSGVGHPPDTRT